MNKKFNPYKQDWFLVGGKRTLIHPYAQETDKGPDGEPIPAPETDKPAQEKSKPKRKKKEAKQ